MAAAGASVGRGSVGGGAAAGERAELAVHEYKQKSKTRRRSRILSERQVATHESRVGRVDESNTQPPRRTLLSDSVGATRRATAEKGESTVALCRSDTSTCRCDSTTRVGDDV